MKSDEMLRHLKEKNCGVGTHSVKTLSTGQNQIFRQLTVGDVVRLAKLAMEADGSKTVVLNDMVQKLSLSGVPFDTITELDRLYYVAGIKNANLVNLEEPTAKFKCSRCKKELAFTFNTEEYMKKLEPLHVPNFQYESATNVFTVGLPAASTWEAWMQYTDTLSNQMKGKDVDSILKTYETVPFIRQAHKFNGIAFEGSFDALPFDKKIELFNNLSTVESQSLTNFLMEKNILGIKYGVTFDVKCTSCGNVNPVLVGAEHFFSF